MSSTSAFLASGIHEDVPTGITPKKKNWDVPQTWETTGPREALLEAFRRRKETSSLHDSTPVENDDDAQRELEIEHEVVVPGVIPSVQSSESLLSLGSDDTVSSLGKSQLRKPAGKNMRTGMDPASKVERVMVPLGESRGNIPVPRKTKR